MAAVTVASVILLFFLPLDVIRNAVGQPYYEYDYLQFVLQYPITVNRTSNIDKRFTIHGLWPANVSDPYVKDCGPDYNETELSKLLRDDLKMNLNYSWPDVVDANNSGFWTNQYNKHGTCTRHRFTTPQAYFEKADDLYQLYGSNGTKNLYNLFVDGGILPGQQSDTSRFMNITVQNATGGKRPRLWCKKHGKENLLKEVVICYNKAARNVIDCPPYNFTSACEGFILIPTVRAPYVSSKKKVRALYGPTILVLFFSLPLGLIIYKYGPSYIKSKLA